MRKKNYSKKEGKLLGVLLKGTLVSILLYPLVSLLLCIICYNTKDPTAYTGLFSLSSFVISGAVSAFINVKISGREGIGAALLSSLFALCIYFAARIIFSSGIFSLFSIFNSVIYFITSLLFALLANKKPKTKKRKLRF